MRVPQIALARNSTRDVGKICLFWYTSLMITIPLYTIFFAYCAGVLLFAALLLVDFFHLVHTGTFTLTSFFVTAAVLGIAAIIFWATWYLLQGTDWQTQLTIWSNAWFGNIFSSNQIFSPFH